MEKIKIQTFLDGVCDIWQQSPDGQPTRIHKRLRFNNRVVGSKRNFEAMQVGHTISKVIRVPLRDFCGNGCHVVIGQNQYEILQCQGLEDTSPKCTQLTLELPNILWALNRQEAAEDGRS